MMQETNTLCGNCAKSRASRRVWFSSL